MSEGRAARDDCASEGVESTPTVPAGYRHTEVGVIPEDWGVSTVGSEFKIQLGKMLDAAKNTGISKPYLGNRSVQWGRIDLAELNTVPMRAADLQRFVLRPGDLLVCEGGEVGRAAIWDEPIRECYYQKALHRLRPAGVYDAYLMMSLLQLWASTGYLNNYVTQTSIAHLPKEKLEIVPLPVPPEIEQRAIAAILTDVDELIGSLEALIPKKRAIKQAAMQQLLTGRTRLPGFVGEWKVVQLGVFVRIRNRKISPVDVRGETPCVELDHIGQGDGRLVSHGTAGRTSSIKHRFEPRDILFGRLRPYLRKWWYADRRGVCSTEIWPLVVDRGRAESGFVYALVQTDRFLDAAEASYGTHMPRADWNIVAGVEFQLPPVSEQRAIATILSDMDAEIAALERRLDKTRAVKQGMMQQLLTGSIRLPVLDDSRDGDTHGT